MRKLSFSFLCMFFFGMAFAQEVPPNVGSAPSSPEINGESRFYNFDDISMMRNMSHHPYPPLESGEMRYHVYDVQDYDDLNFGKTEKSSDNGYFNPIDLLNSSFDVWAACDGENGWGYTSSPPYYVIGNGAAYYADFPENEGGYG